MKVVEFFLMSGMGKSVSRWGVHVGMSALLVHYHPIACKNLPPQRKKSSKLAGLRR